MTSSELVRPVHFVVTGAGGQLGRAVCGQLAGGDDRVTAARHADLPVEDAARVDAVFAQFGSDLPVAVLHCGAWTDVDGCEGDPAKARRINGDGTANLASACQRHGAALVYVSTDFVFDGGASTPYPVDAEVAPLSEYGRSKLAGERATLETGLERACVVRTSWVFGPGGKNFPAAILGRARRLAAGEDVPPLRVVDDQVGRPTYTVDLAEALIELGRHLCGEAFGAARGVFHAANEGQCSWHGFAEALVAAAGLDGVPVGRMSSSELDRPAARPAYSVLDTSRLAHVRGRPLPTFEEAIARYLDAEASASTV